MTLTPEVDVELRGVGLRYEDTEPGAPDALTGIDLHVPAGTILGLLGRNGSGKTSLMSLVASLRRPTAGEALGLDQPPVGIGIAGVLALVAAGAAATRWLIRGLPIDVRHATWWR